MAQTAMLAAGAAVIGFVGSSIKAFSEQEQVMAQTEAVLKSTGGQANLTAEDVTNLASRLRELTSIDDEAIQASSNLLLTFRDVRNEVGKGNDIFNQAQVAILDMATALNQGAIPSSEELKSATLSLGKALNDPIRGMTALRRVGVSFNESQTETITKLAESGDLMGAQKVILGELTKEFGGAAEAAGDTFAGKISELKNTFEDLQETVGSFTVETLTDFLKGLEQIGGFLNITGPSLEETAQMTKVLVNEWQNGTISATELQASLQDLADASGNVITIDEELQTQIAALTIAEERRTRGLPVLRGATDDVTAATDDAASATDRLTEAQRENRLQVLAATDAFLGIQVAASDLAEAQRELNRLERQGKDDTKAYESAVLDALAAQIGLEEAVFNYGKELVENGTKTGNVIEKIKGMGDELGITKGAVNDLIERIRAYINEIERVPERVTTVFEAKRIGQIGSGDVGGPTDFQHGGVVERTGLAMVHKGEVFSGVNNEMGFGGINGDIVLNIDGQTFARITRDQLLKLQNRNATSGI